MLRSARDLPQDLRIPSKVLTTDLLEGDSEELRDEVHHPISDRKTSPETQGGKLYPHSLDFNPDGRKMFV